MCTIMEVLVLSLLGVTISIHSSDLYKSHYNIYIYIYSFCIMIYLYTYHYTHIHMYLYNLIMYRRM